MGRGCQRGTSTLQPLQGLVALMNLLHGCSNLAARLSTSWALRPSLIRTQLRHWERTARCVLLHCDSFTKLTWPAEGTGTNRVKPQVVIAKYSKSLQPPAGTAWPVMLQMNEAGLPHSLGCMHAPSMAALAAWS